MRGRILIFGVLLATCAGWASASQSPAKSWLGVLLGDAVDGGVQVVALVPDGPAQKAGLASGDIILQANEVPVSDRETLSRLLVGFKPGDSIKLGILRSGESMELPVELGDWRLRIRQPAEPMAPKMLSVLQNYRIELALDRGLLGLEVAEITPDLRGHYGAPGDAGVLVIRVDPEEPAGLAGIEVGDILVRIDGRKISRQGRLEEILLTWEGEQPLEIQVMRNREPVTLELTGGLTSDGRASVVTKGTVLPPVIDPNVDFASVERRLRAEIESLERRLREMRRILQELESNPREEPGD
jgi:serine protease Do